MESVSIKNRRTANVIIGIILLFLIGILPVWADGNIEVILRNFHDVRTFHGDFKHSPIVEVGIPASEHILIVKNCDCLDNATDKKGREFYFYMVDQANGLKALITATELDAVDKLDDKTREFLEVVKNEILKDGGIEVLIKKFSKPIQGVSTLKRNKSMLQSIGKATNLNS